jgi:hypothetical protein
VIGHTLLNENESLTTIYKSDSGTQVKRREGRRVGEVNSPRITNCAIHRVFEKVRDRLARDSWFQLVGRKGSLKNHK